MLSKRIIPCLDIKDGRTVKGVNFVGLRDAGNPVDLAEIYSNEGADELVFLDITATHEKRKTLIDLVRKVGERVNIPFTVGGGISELNDVHDLLHAGADKVSFNSAAVKNPDLIDEFSNKFGSQCVVVAVDAKSTADGWKVFLRGGRDETELNLFDWVKEAQERGAGEILFTSMNHDGTKAGFANKELKKMTDLLTIPVIASGGAGEMSHFTDTFNEGCADAALAASIFHFKEIAIPELKEYLHNQGINIRK